LNGTATAYSYRVLEEGNYENRISCGGGDEREKLEIPSSLDE
jgi:hypothetical protein